MSKQVAITPSRFEVLKETVRSWWSDRFKVGEALREIRDDKLYKHEHKTFEEFCEFEYDFKRAHAYRLIGFADVKASVVLSPIGDKIQHESQARALAAVPEEQRVEVLEATVESGPLTAKRIKETARVIQVVPEPAPVVRDKTGYPIPVAILPDWERAEEFREVLNKISQVKSVVKKGLEDKDVIFKAIDNTALSPLESSYSILKQILPYAVCTTCQGRTRKTCSTCKGRGFLDKWFYERCVPEETKSIREKALAK